MSFKHRVKVWQGTVGEPRRPSSTPGRQPRPQRSRERLPQWRPRPPAQFPVSTPFTGAHQISEERLRPTLERLARQTG